MPVAADARSSRALALDQIKRFEQLHRRLYYARRIGDCHMHGRDYCRYSRAVFSEELELFKALIFFFSASQLFSPFIFLALLAVPSQFSSHTRGNPGT